MKDNIFNSQEIDLNDPKTLANIVKSDIKSIIWTLKHEVWHLECIGIYPDGIDPNAIRTITAMEITVKNLQVQQEELLEDYLDLQKLIKNNK